MIITDVNKILGFMKNEIPDYKGRFHKEILLFSDEQLEQCHDQIQWLFPLHEESAYAKTYPIVTKELIDAIFNDWYAEEAIEKAYFRIRDFLNIYDYTVQDHLKPKYKEHSWCVDGNHNLLRITRIIRCLRLFDIRDFAIRFYNNAMALGVQYDLNEKTLKYWTKAMFDDKWATLK